MILALLKRHKGFEYNFIAKFFHQFFLSLFNLAFRGVFRLINAFKSVNQRALTILVLSVFLTACGGGGGGSSSDSTDTPPPAGSSPSLSLSVSSSALTLSEDFSPAIRIATAANAIGIRVSQSTTGVVSVTTSVTSVSVSSILNASGRTTLTITASSGTLSTETQVVVQVTAVNDPPSLSVSTDNISVNVGFSTITINTTASDVEEGVLPFTVQASNAGVVRVTTSANAIFLNAIPAVSGRTTLRVSVVDNSGTTVSQSIVLNVTIVASNTPVLTLSTNLIHVQEDFSTAVVFRTTATDVDGDAITVSVSASMPIVTAVISAPVSGQSTITNRITITAINNANGTATLTVRATDVGGQTNSTEIVVVVAAVNDTPTLTVPTTTLTVLEDFDSTNSVATFADTDSGDTLIVTVTESSTGIVTVTTSASGVSVSAIAHRNGRTTLNMSVSDGLLSSTAQVVVDVTPVNDPPVLSVSTSALTLSEDFGAFLIATTRTDIDSTTLTFTVVESASGIVSVSTSSAGVQLRSTDNISGATTLTITLSDDSTSTSIQVSVIVTAINDTPTFDVSTRALTLNEDFATTQLITVNRSDIENDTLTLSVAKSMSNIVRVSTSSTGVQVVSIGDANGQTTLTITVSDGQASASTQVVVTVNAVNDTPTLSVSSNSISTVGGFSPITINTTASDVEDANISFTVINANTRVVRVTTSTNAFVLNNIPGASGQTTLTVRVVDSSGTTVTEIITVSVSITISATPVVTVSTNLISVSEDFGTSVIIQATATDADGDTITVSVSASMPIVTAVISTPVSGQSTITNSITLTAIDNANGTATLTVLASDSGGQSHSTEIVVVVRSVEDEPTLNIPSATLTVAEDFASTLTIATASDTDGDTLLISVVESTTGIVAVTTSASGVSVSSIRNANGQTTLTITVNDGNQDSTAQVVINVTEVNDPPTLTIPRATLTVVEDFVGGISVATATDVDSNSLTLTVTESSTGIVTVITSASEVRISSRGEANGITTLVITVNDGTVSSTAQVVVTVTAVNDTPTISVSTSVISLSEDFSTTIPITVTRGDVDSNTLTLTVAESTTGVVSVTSSVAGVRVAPISHANGQTTLTIMVSDGNKSATTQVAVTVTAINDTPTISVSTSVINLFEDFSTTIPITVTRGDVDSNTLTLTVAESSTGVVSVTTTDAGVRVAPIAHANGQTTLTIMVSDGNKSATAQVTVTVTAVNDTPTLSVSTSALTLFEDFSTTIPITVTRGDVDSNTLTLTVVESATGVVSVTTSVAGVRVAPISHANGQTTLTIMISDGAASKSTQVAVTVIAVNDTPTLSVSTDNITATVGFSTITINITASDIEDATLPFSVVASSASVVRVTTSANAIILNAILGISGQTTLTVRTVDSSASVATQLIAVNVINRAPVLEVSTNRVSLREDFTDSVVFRTTATDADGDTITLSVSSSSRLVDVVLSTLTNGMSTLTLTAISNENGITTLTIEARTAGQTVSTEVVVIVASVNDTPTLTIPFASLTVSEDFATSITVATAADVDLDVLTFSIVESTTGVVRVTTSGSSVQILSLASISGRTTLTISVNDGTISATGQVAVTVTSVNDTPTISVSTSVITLLEDFSTTIPITVTRGDIDSNILTLTVVESATGVVTVTTTVAGVNVAPIGHANGQTTLTFTVSDGDKTASAQALVTVIAVNDTPTLNVSTNLISTGAGFSTITINTTATDIEDSTLPISVVASPAGQFSVTTSTNAIILNSIPNASGQVTLTVSASDSSGVTVSQTIIVNLSTDSTPIVTVSTNRITVFEDFSTAVVFTATAMDPDGESIGIVVVQFTPLVDVQQTTLTNNMSTITITSRPHLNGITTMQIATSDIGGRAAVAEFVLEVIPVNDPLVLSVPLPTLNLREDFSNASTIVTVTNLDNDTLTVSVAESTTGVVRVTTSNSGVRISNIANGNGRTTLSITINDGDVDSTAQVVVIVTAVDDPPMLSVSTTSLILAEDFATVLIDTTRTDVDGDTLTVSLTVSTPGIITAITQPTGIQIAPFANVSGQTILTISLTDGTTNISTQVSVTVMSVNDTPTLTLSTDNLVVVEDFTDPILIATATDVESATLTFSVVESTTGVVSVTTSATGVRIAPIQNVNGDTTLTISVSDGSKRSTAQAVVTVLAVNDTPTINVSISNLILIEDFSTTSITVSSGDIDSNTLTLTVVESATGVVSVTTSSTGVQVAPIANANGRTTLTLMVSDSNISTSTQVVVTVIADNDTPTLTITTANLVLAEDFTGTSTIATADDVDGDTLTLTVANSNTSVVSVTTSAAGVQVVANAHANGQTTLTITVTDGTTPTTTQVRLTVTAVNDPPTLIVSTNRISTFVGFSTITINTTASDIEDSTLSFSVLAFPTGVVRVTTSANAIVLSAYSGISGQTTITVRTNDSSASVVTQLIAVNVINRAPVLEVSMNRVSLQEDFSDSLVIRTTATDVDGDTITLSLSSSTRLVNAVMSALSNGMSTITLTAIGNANGTTTLTVQAMTAGQSVSTEIVVFVAPVNDTPTLSVSTNSLLTTGGFTQITIHTTASDVEQGTLSFAVQQSSTGVVNVSTSTNAIVLNAIANISGQTTLTVRTTDSAGLTAIQVIRVNVTLMQSDAPVLSVSTNLIMVQEDFTTSVVIRTTATDAGQVTLSILSSAQLVNAVLSTPVNGLSVITNTITISSIADLNGTTTLTIQATDSGGVSTTEQVVVVVNAVFDPIAITLSTSAITLSVNGSQLDRNVQSINISNVDNQPQRVQLQVTSGGGPIFSANPSPVASFTTNVLTTVTTLTSAASTAQLYFTVAPNSTGTGMLVVQLTDLATSLTTQQTMVVSVISPDVPPIIVPTVSSLNNLVVHGGRLYANAFNELTVPLILEQARSLGGHLININSVEELNFVRGATSSLITQHAWFGLALPQPDFPGELSWITNNSTTAYGFVSTTTRATGTITVYPGHFPLNWDAAAGLIANRSNGPAEAFNWTVYSSAGSGVFFLVGDRGDANHERRGLYEFPQGITPSSMNPIALNFETSTSLSLTGFDLNGDAINTSDWSITDPNGGTATFNHVFQNSGVQRVNMIYTAPANFIGQTTVVVTLGVNGLSTTYAVSFIVDGPPTIALSTNAITLAEEFSNFVIGITVTDQGVSGNLPFSVQTTSTGIVNLTTTINSIQFSGALDFNGRVTLTVQATDSAAQTVSTLVVVTVEGVNDTPTISVSTDNISTLGGFAPITIDTTATDIEQGALPFSVQASPQGVVSISTGTNAIVLTPIVGGSGRTTLTVSAIDDGNKTGIQTIAVNVIVMQSTTPVLSVSTNLIGLQEDFATTFMIGTTANDVESGTLVVTVSSLTHLVNSVISTHGITLSSVANLFGTTTLTVRARDDGGLFDSTEIVVIVEPVNDTPTLSVSSNTVNLGSAPVVLNVTASDLEDGVLSFGASNGHVNIAITTTSLTLTRLNQSGQVLLTLTSTDTEGGTASTVVRVTISPFFDVTTGIKTLDFSWSAVSSATHYQLQSNPNGSAGFADLSTTGMVVSPNSTNIMQTTAQGRVALHRYIPRVSGPQFVVNGCNGASCGASIGNTVALTNAQLNGMIGRFQASNPDSEDRFGWSVGLSGDGNTLAVGAYREGGSSTGVNGAQNNDSTDTGAVYLFRRIGGAWLQQAYIKASNPSIGDQFGFSVSLNDDGNVLVVGAPSEDGTSNGVNRVQTVGANNTGAVYAFRFSGSVWSQQAYIKASNTGDGDLFGYAVSLSGDGNTLAVGARNEDSSSTGVNGAQNNDLTDTGVVYLFRRMGGMWSQQAFIKASNSSIGIQFGHSVSLNKDGDTLAAGAILEGTSSTGVNGNQNTPINFSTFQSGAVYLFRFNPTSSTWSQQAFIKASNSIQFGNLGHSVDLSDDGNTLAAGAIGEQSDSTGVNGMHNLSARGSGAAYVFRFNTAANTWSQQAFIKASNTDANDGFGNSVSLSGDGNTLVVGATGEDGTANGVEGTNHASLNSTESGAAYVFEFSNDRWAQQAFIKATDTSANAIFGQSVSISSDGGTIAVGAQGVNTNSGAVYLY